MISRSFKISTDRILQRRKPEVGISVRRKPAIKLSAVRISLICIVLSLTFALSGCGRVAANPSAAGPNDMLTPAAQDAAVDSNQLLTTAAQDAAADSDKRLTPAAQETSAEPEAMVTLEADQNILLKIHGEIVEEMKKPRSLIYGVSIGWALIDGEVTGFGPSGKESRVVAEVDSTVYDSYIEKWSKLYGDMVYVEPVTVILKDQVSTYTELLNQDTSVTMEMEDDSYDYGTKEATLLVTNHTDQDIMHDDMEIYEKLVDGVWYTIFQDYFSDCIGYMVMADDTSKYELYIPIDLLDFEKGTYRVIKKINEKYYSAEFSIQ